MINRESFCIWIQAIYIWHNTEHNDEDHTEHNDGDRHEYQAPLHSICAWIYYNQSFELVTAVLATMTVGVLIIEQIITMTS